MALIVVATGAAATANNAAVTPALPAGVQAGDLMLCHAMIRDQVATLAIDQGWSERFEDDHSASSFLTHALFYKVHDGSEVAPTVTPTGGGAGDDVIAQITAFRPGSGQTAEFDSDGAHWQDAGTQQNIGPITGFTPINPDAVVIVLGVKSDDWTSVATLSGDGLTWVEIGEPVATAGSDAGLVWGYAIIAGAPVAIADKTFTVTGGAAARTMGRMTAIYPAAIVSSGSGTFGGTGTFTGAGRGLGSGSGTLAGQGSLSGTGTGLGKGSGALSGLGTFSGTGNAIAKGSGAQGGLGAFTGAGQVPGGPAQGSGTFAGLGTFAGSGAVVGLPALIVTETGSIPGAGGSPGAPGYLSFRGPL